MTFALSILSRVILVVLDLSHQHFNLKPSQLCRYLLFNLNHGLRKPNNCFFQYIFKCFVFLNIQPFFIQIPKKKSQMVLRYTQINYLYTNSPIPVRVSVCSIFLPTFHQAFSNLITDLDSMVQNRGYKTILKMNRKLFRIPFLKVLPKYLTFHFFDPTHE